MSQPSKRVFTFGDYRLDASERLLLHGGQPLPLTPKVFDALLLLVENAGHLVEKDEFLRRLWPDTFVGDDTLAQNISLLRKAIADEAGPCALITTVPRRGYRFVGSVQEIGESVRQVESSKGIVSNRRSAPLPALQDTVVAGVANRNADVPDARSRSAFEGPSEVIPASSPVSSPHLRVRGGLHLMAAAAATAFLAGALTYSVLAPDSPPRVSGMTQITHSGRVDPWGRLISDGSRLYFLEREGDHWNLVQTSMAGGETETIPGPFRNTLLLDLSPDHSTFLIANFVYRGTEMPLWTWPVQGGSATRIGTLTGLDAAWHPNGRQIVYTKDDGIYLADRDGLHSARFASTRGQPLRLAWSPDGTVLRFSVMASGVPGSSLWEIGVDGTNLHELLPHWSRPPVECCGAWSSDGSDFFFGSSHGGSQGLWVLREKGGIFKTRHAGPSQLTAGEPAFLSPPVLARDGHMLYAFGLTLKSELVSYALKLHQFTPFIPGGRTDPVPYSDSLSYSRDGEWLTYVSTDGILWKTTLDGKDRRALTASSIHASSPAWSPDGTQIAFLNHTLSCDNKLYLISASGGAPRELFPDACEQSDPTWSPDGRFLAYARREILPSGKAAPTRIDLLDLPTNQVSTLQGSEGLRAASWSPDGRFIAAATEDLRRVMLFDLHTQKWTELSRATLLNSTMKWSSGGSFLYFQDLLAPNEPVYRIRIKNQQREEVMNFEPYIRAGVPRCALVGLAPDGSILASLLRNHSDVYALDLELH